MNHRTLLLIGISLLMPFYVAAQTGVGAFNLQELLNFHVDAPKGQLDLLETKSFWYEETQIEQAGNRPIKVNFYVKTKKEAQKPKISDSFSDLIITRVGADAPTQYYETNYLFFDREIFYNFRKDAKKQGFVEQVGRIYPQRFEYIYTNSTYKLICYTATERGHTLYGVRIFKL